MRSNRFRRAVAYSVALAGVLRVSLSAGPPQVQPVSPEAPAFREFTQRVQQYLKQQEDLPRLRTTRQGGKIAGHRSALARKIREMRSNAKQGDIFAPEVTEEFRRVIRSAFQGPNGSNVRKTIRQGDPVPGRHLTVNGDYPDHLPLTTVPPTLLLSLPQLPPEVAYRIIGHDFVLQDTRARLIVDFIPGVVP